MTPTRMFDHDNPCKGPLEVIEECNKQTCPEWTTWGEWSECSNSCGGGQKRRLRQCIDSNTGQESFCTGSNEDVMDCNTQDCPHFGGWSEWSPCSKSCGGGERSKVRECIVPRDGDDSLCEGNGILTEKCNTQPCPVWSEWTPWMQCTATCGGGQTKRIRNCLLPQARNVNGTNLHGCPGDTWEMKACNTEGCPTWTEWTPWTACTKTCEGGKRVRTRECKVPASLGKQLLALFCPGKGKVIEDCNTDPCPKPTEWGGWGECSASCGGGTRRRTRECVNFRDAQGNPCNEDLEEEEACNEQPCPSWTEWTPWTSCTKTCGGGKKKRARDCVVKERSLCIGEDSETMDCNDNTCPSLTDWSEWTTCTQTCGGGTKRRERNCLVQRSGVGNDCMEPLSETMDCNGQECPFWTPWSEWSECSKSCGGGDRSKVRQCIVSDPLRSETLCQGSANASETCNTNPCPEWTTWSEWGDCSATCGGGMRQRIRQCANPTLRNGQLVCDGEAIEEVRCSEEACPEWGEWAPWSDCTSSCGGGTRDRHRTCSQSFPDDLFSDLFTGASPCVGDADESQECNADVPCPKPPEWTSWSEWSECSKTCGGGSTKRSRKCRVPRGSRMSGGNTVKHYAKFILIL